MATRIGTTLDMTGGCASRKLRFCSLPSRKIATARVVSGPSEPRASKRPTSLSSVKEKLLHHEGGAELTRDRATADARLAQRGKLEAHEVLELEAVGKRVEAGRRLPTVRSPIVSV
jgi:hypothetical protein